MKTYTAIYYGTTEPSARTKALSDKCSIWKGKCRTVTVSRGKLTRKNVSVGFSKRKMNAYKFTFRAP